MAAKTTIYKLKSSRVQGVIYVCYRDGLFSNLDCADATLTAEQCGYLLRTLPPREAQLQDVNMGTLTASLVVPRSVKDKVVLFCANYKSYRGVVYVPKLIEKANLKDVPVTNELLTVFFESPLQNFTLKNYIDRINITKDQARNGRAGTVVFPNQWDARFAAGLSGETLTSYRAHLRSLEWRYDSSRGIWVAPE